MNITNIDDDEQACARAIARSISHHEIVTIDYSRNRALVLADVCENSIEVDPGNAGGARVEYWGTEDGDDWRVHLQRPEEESAS